MFLSIYDNSMIDLFIDFNGTPHSQELFYAEKLENYQN